MRKQRLPIAMRHAACAALESLETRRLFAVITVTTSDVSQPVILNDGKVTIFEAIFAANGNANFGDAVGVGGYGADTIMFNIPGAGVHTFATGVKIPEITDTLTIDGYSQPGASPNTLVDGNNAKLLLEFTDTTDAANLEYGLFKIQADNCVIRGLVLNGYASSLTPDPNKANAGIRVEGKNARIEGNFIGTDPTGTLAIKNHVGVAIGQGGDGAIIGGTTPAGRNVISGNDYGIYLRSNVNNVHVSNVTIQGNYIGTDASGTQPLGNNVDGVHLQSLDTLLGGSSSTATGNVIAFNGRNGVALSGGSSTRNRILRNTIHSNGGLGIGVPDNGGVPNSAQDANDADGPNLNGLQNIPILESAVRNGANTDVRFRLSTTPNTNYRVEFFSNAVADPTGFGEGRMFVGSVDVTTDASGAFGQTVSLAAIAPGEYVTATVTGPDGTSEFSNIRTVQAPGASLPLVVTNTNDGGAGSLRQAILNANLMVNGASPDEIAFNIPGAGIHTIKPLTPLPILDDSVFVNGYSQPGSSPNSLALGNNATLLIEIDGSLAGNRANGLAIAGKNSTVRGLAVNRFKGPSALESYGIGIYVLPYADGAVIAGNYVGTNPTGTSAAGNVRAGVAVEESANVLIGGPTPGDRNLVSGSNTVLSPTGGRIGSLGKGISVVGGRATGARIQNNYTGTNAAGTGAIGNTIGIFVLGAAGATIGGTSANLRNIASGNDNYGIFFEAANGTIQGNFIGTDRSGASAVPNASSGLAFVVGSALIGGVDPGARNVISGNGRHGIDINSADLTLGNEVTIPNQIAAIENNYIGTDAAGDQALPNAGDGIRLAFAFSTVIGGTTAAQGNVISGNLGSGIGGGGSVNASGAILTAIQNNRIGLDVNNNPMGNQKDGINFRGLLSLVGDPAIPGTGNTIAYNMGKGIVLADIQAASLSIGTVFSQNRVFNNGGIAIDLGDDGITPNDAGDADTGHNGLQNTPELLSATRTTGGNTTVVHLKLDSAASKTYRIEFFANAVADPSGFGEAETYVGSADILTGTNGKFDGVLTLPFAPAVGSFLTATATSPSSETEFGETSELARNIAVDPVPTFSIADGSKIEGNTGTATLGFTVTLSKAYPLPITIDYGTASGSASSGSDYAFKSGTLTFAAGETSKTIDVTVNGDTTFEPNETFFVNLTNASAGTISDATGQGTIDNDDTPTSPPPPPPPPQPIPPTLSIADVTLNEGTGSSPTRFVFTVTRAGDLSGPSSAAYATGGGMAASPGDYAATSGTVSFVAGEQTRTITVNVVADSDVESDETFNVVLSNASGATIADGSATGTIQNDDVTSPPPPPPPPPPTVLPKLSINDVRRAEGNSGTTAFVFTVTRSGDLSAQSAVNWATANGTALLSKKDYRAGSGKLTFAPGVATKTITVLVNGDTIVGVDETFYVNLTKPTGATITDSRGVGYILNDDIAVPKISIANAQAPEGRSGLKPLTFTITLDHAYNKPVTFDFKTANGTAKAGSDFAATAGKVTFQPGQLTRTVVVQLYGDTKKEAAETFTVNLLNPSNGKLKKGSAIGTILNDD